MEIQNSTNMEQLDFEMYSKIINDLFDNEEVGSFENHIRVVDNEVYCILQFDIDDYNEEDVEYIQDNYLGSECIYSNYIDIQEDEDIVELYIVLESPSYDDEDFES